jgi:hypothetical protein
MLQCVLILLQTTRACCHKAKLHLQPPPRSPTACARAACLNLPPTHARAQVRDTPGEVKQYFDYFANKPKLRVSDYRPLVRVMGDVAINTGARPPV